MKCSRCGLKIPAGADSCKRCGTPVARRSSTVPTKAWRDGEIYDERNEFFFNPGDAFGERYRIEEEIGRGGMGRVYKAWDNELEIHVAIKMIHPELLSRSDAIRRFKKELILAREITHENVVRIYDFGELQGIKFISMQYIDGENLGELIQSSGAIKLEQVINIASQVCRGLRTAHKLGIIHRDLKPQNIMVAKNGRVYITDFGLAKSLEDPSLSLSGVVMGTPQYISPEQAKGEKLDQRCDIYTFGVLLYEMITGKELFSSETALGYLQKHIQEKPTSPSAVNAAIPAYLEKIILKCLEKERRDRYQELDAVLADLEKEKTKSQPIWVPHKVKKIAGFVIAFFIVLAVALTIYQVVSMKGTPSAISVAVLPFEIRSSREDLYYWRETFQDLLITDLDQSRYFNVLPGRQVYEILQETNLLDSNFYSTQDLREVARKGKISHIVYGKLLEAGGWFQVMVGVWKVDTEEDILIEPLKVKEVENFPALVDQLTEKIKYKFLNLHLIRTDIADKEVSQITTHYPEALKYYTQGKKLVNEGNFEQSVLFFQKAIAIDPQFAEAYRCMAWSYRFLNDYEKHRKYFLKTLELLEHVSLREQYLIQADYYTEYEDTQSKAIDFYKNLLKLYPGDNEGHNKLGMTYYIRQEWGKAIEHLEICRANGDPDLFSYLFLGYSYMAKGKMEKSRKIFYDYRVRFADHCHLHRSSALAFFLEGKYNLALSALAKAKELYPNDPDTILLECNIYLVMGELDKAEKLLQETVTTNKYALVVLDAYAGLRNLYLLQGKIRQSIDVVNHMLQLARRTGEVDIIKRSYLLQAYTFLNFGQPQDAVVICDRVMDKVLQMSHQVNERTALYFKALAQLELGETEAAVNTAEELKKAVKKGAIKNHIKYYYHILGVKALKEKNYAGAISYIKKSISYLSCPISGLIIKDQHAFFYYTLAAAYFESGEIDKAENVYRDIIELNNGRVFYGDVYALSLYHLGKILYRQGQTAKAQIYLQKFTHLWRNADPLLKSQEVTDAQEILKTLKK